MIRAQHAGILKNDETGNGSQAREDQDEFSMRRRKGTPEGQSLNSTCTLELCDIEKS